MSDYPTDFERLEVAEAEIKRLTAELAARDVKIGKLIDDIRMWRDQNTHLAGRENALRQITNNLRTNLRLHKSTPEAKILNEWDRRAGEVT